MEIQIETKPPELVANFEQLEAALQEHLSHYETVVTEDGVKDAKAAATEINKLKQELAKRRKAAADEAKQPIQDFENRMKSLEQQAEDARQKILTQVDAYDQQVRDQARDALTTERDRLWRDLEVREAHRRAAVDDLVKTTAITAKGSLTKGSRESVEVRVREDRSRQDMVDRRLADLEARSYRAGLAAPITEDQVSQWLESDDETYEPHVERLINAELEREAEAVRVERERQERRQAAEQATAPTPEPEPEPAQEAQGVPPAEPEQGANPGEGATPEIGEDGKVAWTVTATFELRVKPEVSREAIEAEARKMFERVGIKTLASVEAGKA